jgi:tRNA (mo5U34)-methyltransferase
MNNTEQSAALRQKLTTVAEAANVAMAAGSWWHSIDLGAGRVTPGVHPLAELQENYARLALPEDLSNRRLLDIGCWDGFYSFEAERHGAQVVSVDCWRPENFFKAKAALESRAEFHELSVYEVTQARLGSFDYVLFLGVLYHLRHPLLALEQVCEVTREFAVIESHVIDNLYQAERPVMEFYEFDELGGQYDNWWGPNVECMAQMARAAGFARVELLYCAETRAAIKAYRRWDDKPANVKPSLQIERVRNAVTNEDRFPRRGRHAFIALWVAGLPANIQRWEVRVEIAGFGVHPTYVGAPGDARDSGLTQINVPVPPGVELGSATICVWHQQNLSEDVQVELIEGSQW